MYEYFNKQVEARVAERRQLWLLRVALLLGKVLGLVAALAALEALGGISSGLALAGMLLALCGGSFHLRRIWGGRV